MLIEGPEDKRAVRDEAAAPPGLVGLDLDLDRRQSVADQVHAALRSAIVSVQLRPGEAISENSICRQFAVSRTPVRAAIQRLSEEGLVDVYPQQGSFVAPIKLGDITDGHFIRRSLELAIFREVAPRWTAAMGDAARAVVASQARALAANDIDRVHAEDERFHHVFAVGAKREGVWGTIIAAKSRLTRFIRLSGNPERLPVVIEEHLAILDALDRNDPAGAEALLALHLDRIFVLFDQLPEEERRHVAP